MRKLLCVLASLAVAALPAAAFVQAGQTRCDMKSVEKKTYCPKCDKVLGKDEAKGKKCSKDETETLMVDVCVKKSYKFACHPAKEAKSGAS